MSYFFTNENLPEILSQTEQQDYFLKYQNGDLKAREQLIVHNIKLVLFFVDRNFSATCYDQQELTSIGMIGLIKAVDTFDLKKKKFFSTYAIVCIQNEIYMYLRNIKKQQKETRMYAENEKENLCLDRIIEDISIVFVEEYEQKELYGIIRNLVSKLPEREKQMLEMYFGFNTNKLYTQTEIAHCFNLSQSGVGRIIKRVLKQISYQLQQTGIIEDNCVQKSLR